MTDADELAAAIGRLQPDFVVTASDAVAAEALEPTAGRRRVRRAGAQRPQRPAHRRPGGPAPAGRRRAGPAHRAVLVRGIGRRARGGGRARRVIRCWCNRWPRSAARGSRWSRGPTTSSRPGSVRCRGGRLAHSRVLVETVVEIEFDVTPARGAQRRPDGSDDRVLRTHRPSARRRRRAGVLAAAETERCRAGRRQVDRRARRQGARRARRLRRRIDDQRRRGVLRRRHRPPAPERPG